MAKKKETEPKGTDKKNEKINGEKTDNVEIEVEKEVSEAESLASQLKDVNDRLLRTAGKTCQRIPCFLCCHIQHDNICHKENDRTSQVF